VDEEDAFVHLRRRPVREEEIVAIDIAQADQRALRPIGDADHLAFAGAGDFGNLDRIDR